MEHRERALFVFFAAFMARIFVLDRALQLEQEVCNQFLAAMLVDATIFMCFEVMVTLYLWRSLAFCCTCAFRLLAWVLEPPEVLPASDSLPATSFAPAAAKVPFKLPRFDPTKGSYWNSDRSLGLIPKTAAKPLSKAARNWRSSIPKPDPKEFKPFGPVDRLGKSNGIRGYDAWGKKIVSFQEREEKAKVEKWQKNRHAKFIAGKAAASRDANRNVSPRFPWRSASDEVPAMDPVYASLRAAAPLRPPPPPPRHFAQPALPHPPQPMPQAVPPPPPPPPVQAQPMGAPVAANSVAPPAAVTAAPPAAISVAPPAPSVPSAPASAPVAANGPTHASASGGVPSGIGSVLGPSGQQSGGFGVSASVPGPSAPVPRPIASLRSATQLGTAVQAPVPSSSTFFGATAPPPEKKIDPTTLPPGHGGHWGIRKFEWPAKPLEFPEVGSLPTLPRWCKAYPANVPTIGKAYMPDKEKDIWLQDLVSSVTEALDLADTWMVLNLANLEFLGQLESPDRELELINVRIGQLASLADLNISDNDCAVKNSFNRVEFGRRLKRRYLKLNHPVAAKRMALLKRCEDIVDSHNPSQSSKLLKVKWQLVLLLQALNSTG